ncbi:hypothetical protein N8T08_007789 [Aspergillus melleus]|uniref:Uncharacterized protein n=1 Tax=Aspergillus melleus TaxID=138277 RepID=A0ACC3BEU3_9EURO|nr:hypothetical protein N8T08_007789 [Aspergillus melleus]
MKPFTYLYLVLGISATTTLAALGPDATPEEVAAAEAECGSLGVMRIDPAELPEGITMDDVRMCANHPLGPGASPALEPGPGAFAGFRRFLSSWGF